MGNSCSMHCYFNLFQITPLCFLTASRWRNFEPLKLVPKGLVDAMKYAKNLWDFQPLLCFIFQVHWGYSSPYIHTPFALHFISSAQLPHDFFFLVQSVIHQPECDINIMDRPFLLLEVSSKITSHESKSWQRPAHESFRWLGLKAMEISSFGTLRIRHGADRCWKCLQLWMLWWSTWRLGERDETGKPNRFLKTNWRLEMKGNHSKRNHANKKAIFGKT